MRRRSISTATILAVTFSSAALSLAAAGSAAAASAVITQPGGITVDGALHKVFVGDASSGKIIATDYDGAVVDSVSGISGVRDLALSDDGSVLYAAAETSHQIVALDAATLEVKASYDIDTTVGPRYVAFTAGKLWFTYGDQWNADLGSVDPAADPSGDPATDPVTLGQYPASGLPKIGNPGLLDANPSLPGVLAVGETGASSDSMAVLDVSSGTPAGTAGYQGDYSLNSGIGDIDVVPGAPQVLVNGEKRDAYAGGMFTEAGAYPSGQLADVAADGLVAQVTGTHVAVYRPDATTPIRTYSAGGAGVADLAWAPDSSRIFALELKGSTYVLTALTSPTKTVPTLTVTAPSSATRAKALTVSGKLSTTVPLPAGVTLQVTRTDLDSPSGKALAAVPLKSDGSYSFSDTPTAGGTVTYKVSYAGDAAHTGVSASRNVAVSRSATTLTVNNTGTSKIYSYNQKVTFTAHLGSTYKNRTVEIWADPYGYDKPNQLVKSGTVNSSGNLSATIQLRRDTNLTIVYKGDSHTAPRTLKAKAYTHALVSTSISRYYKTGKIGSTSYYWFHKSTAPYVTTTMSYYHNRSHRLDLQVYYSGGWHTTGSEYFKLSSSGKTVVDLGAPGESGIKARVRSAYVDTSSGDNVNTTTYGSWKYLYFSS